jgi:hypothetical protein
MFDLRKGIDFDYTLIFLCRGVTSFLFLKRLNSVKECNLLNRKRAFTKWMPFCLCVINGLKLSFLRGGKDQEDDIDQDP